MLLIHCLAENFSRIRWLCSIDNGRNEAAKDSTASVLTIVVAAVPAV